MFGPFTPRLLQAMPPQAARWRITRFINHIGFRLDPVRRALRTFAIRIERFVQRWTSSHSSARLDGPQCNLRGRKRSLTRLPENRHLHNRHRPDSRTAARDPQIHLKRRGARKTTGVIFRFFIRSLKSNSPLLGAFFSVHSFYHNPWTECFLALFVYGYREKLLEIKKS